MRLVPPVTPPARLIVESTSPNTWIDIDPLDFLLDGGGFAHPSFERVFIETTLVTATAAPSFAGGGFFIGWEVDGEMTPDLTIAVTVVDTHTIKAVYTRPGDFDLDAP